jgi:2-polyprenyl-3-methyl-5-hydroxy-6-metoxy-1,4-benzoquinol methylase
MNFFDKRDTCGACLGANIADKLETNGMAFSECADCGFIFMNPMIDHESIAAFYRDYPGTAGYKRKAHKKIKRARGRMRRLSKIVPSGNFLDIGCSAGFVVDAAREVGLNGYGIDLSEEGIAYGQQHFPDNEFAVMSIEEASEKLPKFDLVYTSEVIEHVLDPDSFAQHLAAVMKPGAHLYLTTPDAGHWRRATDLLKWHEFKPPEHCLYFTTKALKILLARHGIKLTKKYFNHKTGLKIRAQKTQ